METRPLDESSPGELATVLALFRTVYGWELSEEFYRWRFLRNPFGPPMVSLLWDGATLAGHYSVCPMRSRVGDRIVRSAQSMTTMTHPNYRNRGVFVTLATDLYARMATEMGVAMVWGFPNTQSHYGFVHRLGWRDIGVVVTLSRAVGGRPGDAPRLAALEAPDDRVSRLFDKSVDGRIYPSCRDAEYLNWRYVENPTNRYTILMLGDRVDALAVVKPYEQAPGRTSLEVVEVMYGNEPEHVLPLFEGLLAFAEEEGHQYLRTWLALTDPAFPALERLGFAPKEPIFYFGGRTLGAFELPEDELRLENWAISMGDSYNY